MNTFQREFLDRATAEAIKANHPFAQMTACEAALESNWGNSELARDANNLFGMKQHAHPVFGTMNLPTREFVGESRERIAVEHGDTFDGKYDGWIQVTAHWVQYPDWRACFCDRLATLERLSNALPHYAAALRAPDATTYLTEVSKTWSTDPNRGAKVLSIYQEYLSQEGTLNV
jgi:flagellum-specific peptidoglycan hydrolase FlgJ